MTKISGWNEALKDIPCSYGVQVEPGNHSDTRQCGNPSVYRTIGGKSCYCADHAQEVAENDKSIWFDTDD